MTIECEMHHPSLAVPDVSAAVDFYTDKLGFTRAFTTGDPATFAGVNLGKVQIFLHRGTPGPTCSVYFVVGDADALHAMHASRGVTIVTPPADRAYELRDYTVRDPHGYELTFGHRLHDAGPPLEIERVDVPVRLETRLAAMLVDLAAHKQMSLASCLEEILLHTSEPLGDGCACPHTPAQLRVIQDLKRKHGIDYDSHASYRFVEK